MSRVRPWAQGPTAVTLSEGAKEEIMNSMARYFFAIQPMRSIEEDNAYITNVVTGFFNSNDGKYMVCTWKNNDLVLADAWKKAKWFPELKRSAK